MSRDNGGVQVYDIALVGAGGFLGAAIGRELRRRGNRVTAFTRDAPLLEGTRLSPRALDADVVVWAAGGLSPAVAHTRPDLAEEELAQFRAAMSAVARRDRSTRVILLSSGGAVYGAPARAPFTESTPPAPANAYGEFKLAEEGVLAELGMAGTALRVANAYGPGQRGARGQGVLAIWMKSIMAGDPITIHGSGQVARDYVYVDDVARAAAAVVECAAPPALLNIGTGQPTTLDDLLQTLTDVVRPAQVQVDRRPSRGMDAASTWLDVSAARDVLGWSARTSLPDGVALMWQWAAQQVPR